MKLWKQGAKCQKVEHQVFQIKEEARLSTHYINGAGQVSD